MELGVVDPHSLRFLSLIGTISMTSSEVDYTKLKIDKFSEAMFQRELTANLKQLLKDAAPDVDVDYLTSKVLPTLSSSISELVKAVEDEAIK
jgi:hypothetical protein